MAALNIDEAAAAQNQWCVQDHLFQGQDKITTHQDQEF